VTLNDNGVLANDTDIDDDLDAILVSGPSFGTLTLDEETGTFTYTPNTGFSGTDTFTYKASDDDGAESNVATVTITVTPASAGSVYLIPDACNPGKTALIVNGTPGADNISISPATGGVKVSFGGVSPGLDEANTSPERAKEAMHHRSHFADWRPVNARSNYLLPFNPENGDCPREGEMAQTADVDDSSMVRPEAGSHQASDGFLVFDDPRSSSVNTTAATTIRMPNHTQSDMPVTSGSLTFPSAATLRM